MTTLTRAQRLATIEEEWEQPATVNANRYRAEIDRRLQLEVAAAALLDRLDNMTTAQFSCGGERAEREALRALLHNRGAK